jgi:hypothetical protein
MIHHNQIYHPGWNLCRLSHPRFGPALYTFPYTVLTSSSQDIVLVQEWRFPFYTRDISNNIIPGPFRWPAVKLLFPGFILVETVNPVIEFIWIHIIGSYAADVEIVRNSFIIDFIIFILKGSKNIIKIRLVHIKIFHLCSTLHIS